MRPRRQPVGVRRRPQRAHRDTAPMLTHRPESGERRRLLALHRSLSAADRATLLAFAEFLAARQAQADAGQRAGSDAPTPEPAALPRPSAESVIAAIRRLRLTYAMLEPGALLEETSTLMSAHVLQGQDAKRTIDALESLFARHYEEFRSRAPGADRPPERSA